MIQQILEASTVKIISIFYLYKLNTHILFRTYTAVVAVVVCRSCNRVGHRNRSHRNCGMRILRNRPAVENVTEETAVPGGTAVPEINVTPVAPEINEPSVNNGSSADTRPALRYTSCLQVGHRRRTHSSCPMNPNLGNTPTGSSRNIAREPMETEVERNDIKRMDVLCSHCNSCMWLAERKLGSSAVRPLFQNCCANGKAILRSVTPIPDVIANLLRNNDQISKKLKKNIRAYNSALSFTSMNAELDRAYANSRGGAYAFRIHGSVHHMISSVLVPDATPTTTPEVIQQPKFAQIYIFDSENELQNRMNVAGNSNVNESTMLILQQMMHDLNPFVRHFKTMKELSDEQPKGISEMRMIFRSEGTPDNRRYNNPTASEIGVLIVGGDDEGDCEPKNRDIVLRLKGSDNALSRINEIHQHFDPLQYVLMFPHGDSGWHCELRSYDSEELAPSTDLNSVLIMQYYSSRLMIRPVQGCSLPKKKQVSLHSFGKLFHQYTVDMYAKVEQERLNFIRFNQDSLRAAIYNGLQDAIRVNDTDMNSIGKRVILPSSFIGGPRFMAQLYQDAMNLVRRFGKPDLFITFTSNPKWEEIDRELLEGQLASDRPDLCARVFNLKLRQLMEDITKK